MSRATCFIANYLTNKVCFCAINQLYKLFFIKATFVFTTLFSKPLIHNYLYSDPAEIHLDLYPDHKNFRTL